MKKKLLILIFSSAFCIHNSFAQAPTWQWAKGDSLHGVGRSIAVDASGNVYATGSFWGTGDFDPGPGIFNLTSVGNEDIFISKLDASGNFVWAKAMGGLYTDESFSIAIDNWGNILTTGSFHGTVDFDPGPGTYNLTTTGAAAVFISKLDASGNFIWAKAMGPTVGVEVIAYSIATDESGNVYTTGELSLTADFDPGPGTHFVTSNGGEDIFISKLDSAGNFVWACAIGSIAADRGLSLTVDASGNIYTTGFFQLTADFDPGPGTYNLTAVGLNDIFISKLDSYGNFVWAKSMGGTDYEFGYSIAIDPSASANVYTLGSFEGTADFDPGTGIFNLNSAGQQDIFISKLDSAGNFVWAKAMGGTSAERGLSLALDGSGSMAAYSTGFFGGTVDFDPGAGTFNLTSAGLDDIFISKLDSAGSFVWAKAVGGINNDNGNSIALDASDNAHVTGYINSPSVQFDSFTLTNSVTNPNTIFIAKLGTDIMTGNNNDIENSGNGVLVFPNPFTTHATIKFSRPLTAATLRLYNMLGELMIEQRNASGSELNINAASLAAGVYVYEVWEKERKIAAGKAVVYGKN